MSDANPEIDFNIVQILNVAASKLQTHFLTGSRGDAKQEFKKLKQGKSIKLMFVDPGQFEIAGNANP